MAEEINRHKTYAVKRHWRQDADWLELCAQEKRLLSRLVYLQKPKASRWEGNAERCKAKRETKKKKLERREYMRAYREANREKLRQRNREHMRSVRA